MNKKFEAYINASLDGIGNGEKQQKFKTMVLNRMTDCADECKIKGMTDEKLIYSHCIESAGDILGEYKGMEIKKQNTVNAVKKVGIGTLISLGLILLTVICYLIVSFVTKEWSKTWLIMIGGVFLSIICGTIFLSFNLGKKGKWLFVRIFTALDIVLLFVFVFLNMIILTDIPKAYVLFLIMVIMVSGIDTAISFGINFKGRIVGLIVFIQIATALEYVMLGVLKMAPWHPYWLIPAAGAFINAMIICVNIYLKIKRKKENQD